MTKPQALALSNALAARKMPHSVTYSTDQAGADVYGVTLDPTRTYGGSDLDALAQYCATNQLTLSLVVQQMGVT